MAHSMWQPSFFRTHSLSAALRWPITLVSIGCLAAGCGAAICLYCPHVPRVHDEFSYLLAADTLMHGRLANDVPEVWQPLQTFHVILEPSYASKYPLGNAMLIAVGWAVLGLPIAGSWLAAAVCAASMTWMLAGVVDRRWAIVGGCLTALHPAMQTSWSHSLLSGWLTVAGSALACGAVLRLRRHWRPSAALLMGVGIGLLALTRPFEGLICTLLSAGLFWRLGTFGSWNEFLHRGYRIVCWSAPPVAVALALTAAQNWATTGSPWHMPYRVHEQTYGVAPLFIFDSVQQPSLASDQLPDAIRQYHHGWSLDCYNQRAGASGWLRGFTKACGWIWDYWMPLLWLIPAACIGSSHGRIAWFLVLACCLQIAASSLVCWVFPHYRAPLFPWLVLLIVLGLRRVQRQLQAARLAAHRYVIPAAFACQLVLLGVATARLPNHPARNWALRRAQLAAGLEQLGGKHLVLVHYGSEHNVHEEWVYNAADLPAASVIWARGERPSWNADLKAAYPDRHVWEIHPDSPDGLRMRSEVH